MCNLHLLCKMCCQIRQNWLVIQVNIWLVSVPNKKKLLLLIVHKMLSPCQKNNVLIETKTNTLQKWCSSVLLEEKNP